MGRAALGVSALYLALYAGFGRAQRGLALYLHRIHRLDAVDFSWPRASARACSPRWGALKRLARTAELFRPLLLLALLPVLGVAIARLDWGELLPIGVRDIPGIALGALECAGTTGFALTFVPLFETGDAVERARARHDVLERAHGPLPYRAYRFRAGPLSGPELSGEFTYPFFALVRNTGLFGVAERVEAPVTALWVALGLRPLRPRADRPPRASRGSRWG